MKSFRPILVVALTIPLLNSADELQAVFAKIDAGATGFKGLTADIHRVAHVDLINEDDPESGTIALKRPKAHDIRMRIDFREPSQKQVAYANNRVEIYYPKLNSVDEYDLRQHKGLVEQFLLLGFGSTSQDLRSAYQIRYIGQEPINGQSTWRVELTPKSQEAAETFPKIELWISQETGMALQQKLHEKGGKDYQLATYSNMKLRPDIADADVKPNYPRDARHNKPPIK